MLYMQKGEVDEAAGPIPLGVADIKREGSDVSVITYGRMVHEALKAAEALEKEGIDVEVLDLRSLYPLDVDAILRTVEKTNRVVVVGEASKRGGYPGEIAAIIAEQGFDYLDAPIVRIGALNTPIPFSPVLEDFVIPNATDIMNGIKSITASAATV